MTIKQKKSTNKSCWRVEKGFQLIFFNPNRVGLFERSFFIGGGQFDCPLIFPEELIQCQYNLSNLFREA